MGGGVGANTVNGAWARNTNGGAFAGNGRFGNGRGAGPRVGLRGYGGRYAYRGYGYYGSGGYGYYNDGPVVVGRSVAETGEACKTRRQVCAIPESYLGQRCSCRTSYGRSFGHVTP
jgi:hypothetical protein